MSNLQQLQKRAQWAHAQTGAAIEVRDFGEPVLGVYEPDARFCITVGEGFGRTDIGTFTSDEADAYLLGVVYGLKAVG